MVLANNDDHRWELFYQDWLNSVGNNIPNQASTLTKGYDLPNLEVAALGYDATLLGIAAESAAEIGVSQELWTRILSDPTTGDDRIRTGLPLPWRGHHPEIPSGTTTTRSGNGR